jgi:predicted Zn finger-like uncharacterized protein
MNVSCPQCSTIYRVDPAKVPQGGVRARCSTCSGVIPVGMTPAAPQSRTTPAEPMSAAFGSRPSQPGPFIPSRPARAATPPAGQSPVRPTPMSSRPTPTPSQAATPQPSRTPPRPTTPVRPMTPASTPRLNTPPAPRAATPPVAAPRVPTPAVPAPAISVPAETPPPRQATPPRPIAAIPPSFAAPPSQPAQGSPANQPTGERRPINPFLARDPSLRAKRLARALVSDMVAYYPAKHAEGLEKGTLKELFRDEIKKSYEEYIAQVGAEFARSTTHFQESLNEVLGAGRKIF